MDDHAVPSLLTTGNGTMPRRHLLQLIGASALASRAGLSDLATSAKTHRKRHKRHKRHASGHHDSAHSSTNEQANGDGTQTLFHDDFHQGFDAASGSGNWFYFSSPPFVGNDGTETISSHGLQVSASQFDLTVAQDDPN